MLSTKVSYYDMYIILRELSNLDIFSFLYIIEGSKLFYCWIFYSYCYLLLIENFFLVYFKILLLQNYLLYNFTNIIKIIEKNKK